jgi:hypothetical protein
MNNFEFLAGSICRLHNTAHISVLCIAFEGCHTAAAVHTMHFEGLSTMIKEHMQ